MRHRRATRKLSRNTSNRIALLRSLVTNLIATERIVTTYTKAKEASLLADRLITLGKNNNATSKKTAISIMGSKKWINRLFGDIAPRFANRKGGYTRVLKLLHRQGDGAKMAILELTEQRIEKKAGKKPKKLKKLQLKEVTEDKKAEKAKPEDKDVLHPPTIAKEKLKEEKEKEKKKSEEKKLQKSFFKGLRRYFRGKSD